MLMYDKSTIGLLDLVEQGPLKSASFLACLFVSLSMYLIAGLSGRWLQKYL